MKIKYKNSTLNGQSGFSLIEVVFAMLILMIGVLAVLTFIIEGIKMQRVARESTEALSFARAAMERLSARPRVQRLVGGNLNDNSEPNYNATEGVEGRYAIRWQIEEGGVPAGAQRVTVRVSSNFAGVLEAPVTIRTLMP